MKKDLKICLPIYKVLYSAAFVLILSFVRGITFVDEIGIALESPIALLTVIFCADTYLVEFQNNRRDVFRLFPVKKQTAAIVRRLLIQMIYLVFIAIAGYGMFYWQKPGEVMGGITSGTAFGQFLAAIPGTVLFWGIFSMTICNVVRNMWAGIGITLCIWLTLVSQAGSDFLGKWNVFSYMFRETDQWNDLSWMYGKSLSVILAVLLILLIPVVLKKRG